MHIYIYLYLSLDNKTHLFQTYVHIIGNPGAAHTQPNPNTNPPMTSKEPGHILLALSHCEANACELISPMERRTSVRSSRSASSSLFRAKCTTTLLLRSACCQFRHRSNGYYRLLVDRGNREGTKQIYVADISTSTYMAHNDAVRELVLLCAFLQVHLVRLAQ